MSRKTQKAAENASKLHEELYVSGELKIPEEPGESEVKTEEKTEEKIAETVETKETKETVGETPVITTEVPVTETIIETPSETLIQTPLPETQVEVQPEVQPSDVLKELQEQLNGLQDKYETEKHRNDTLQGKYNAELPRALQKIKELEDRQTAREEAERLSKQKYEEEKQTKQVDISEQPIDTTKYVSKDEETLWGADFCNFVIKIAKSISEDTTAKKLSKIEPVGKDYTEQFNSMKADDARVMTKVFEMEMASIVSDWESVNKEPEFVEWLKEPDSIGGDRARFDSAQFHMNNLDSARLAKYFQAYKQDKQDKADKDVETKPIAPVIPAIPVVQPVVPNSNSPLSMTAKVNISPGKSHSVKQIIPEETSKTTLKDLREAGERLGRQEKGFGIEEFNKIREKFIQDNREALGGR